MTEQEPETPEPDFPVKIADTLESVADKARSLTVGKAENAAKWVAAGTIMFFLGFLAVILLLIGLSRILGELVGTEVSYAIIGGLFLIGALLLWRQRDPKETDNG
jgi:cytochrome c biogenesis protein CcdA